jgi:signal transduction histidine kinase
MSHELRTPLNAIIGFSDVLGDRIFGELNQKQSEYVGDISTSGRHLLSLVNDVLDLAKVEAGKMELQLAEFSLRDTISTTLSLVRERATSKGVQLAAILPADLEPLTADERKIRQVLLNLLSNALKFTPNGGSVELSVRRNDADVLVSVRDTGVGIRPEDQPGVFEEFRQVGETSVRSEGTGLGLTLTKRFVELHGGRIWLESTPGQGSTFSFTIPLKPAAVVPA